MVRFLQKRKFRLVIRWKQALKENIGFQLPASGPFPFALIFRAFDEIVRLLKCETVGAKPDHGEPVLMALPDDARPTSDQYMELFLTGRDILGEFVTSDESFCARFAAPDRQNLGEALERVFRQLVDREMREYSRRFTSAFSN